MNLPCFMPRKRWIASDDPGVPYQSVYPPIEKRADGMLIVDRAAGAIAVFDNRDHPNARALPPGAPRPVKLLYRRDWQLRCLRAVHAGPIMADIGAALDAWARFCAGRPA